VSQGKGRVRSQGMKGKGSRCDVVMYFLRKKKRSPGSGGEGKSGKQGTIRSLFLLEWGLIRPPLLCFLYTQSAITSSTAPQAFFKDQAHRKRGYIGK
jgi:hypothetical protein